MRKENNSKKINVLIAVDHASYNGNIHGVGRFLLDVLPKVDRTRFKVILCILRNDESLKARLGRDGIRTIQLRRKKFDPLALYDFVRIIEKESIHVLHLHQYASSNFGRIAGKIKGVPTIIHAHGVDENYPWYQWIADSFLAGAASQVIAVSGAVKKACIDNRKINPDRIIIMPNGIPIDNLKPLSEEECDKVKARFGLKREYQIVGSITRLREEKGNLYLLEAAVRVLSVLPNTYFFIAGDGPLLEELSSLCRQWGIIQNVIFAGFCRDIREILSIFDIKVLSSLYEGLGYAILEAMAMCKPILATNVNGINEILRDGETGLLVPPRDPDSMAKKIIHLLQHEEKRTLFGMKAQKESLKYALDTYIENLESLYEKLACC